jgi:hypothetical protein
VTELVFCMLLAAAKGGGEATVTYITSQDGYLDAGSDDGLSVGDTAKIFRRKKQVGTCEITEVSVAGARCKSDRLVPGDKVVFTPAPRERKEPEKPKRIERLSEAELSARRKIVQAATFEKRAHEKGAVAGKQVSARLMLRQQVWGVTTTPGGIFSRSSIDGAVRADIDAGLPLVLSGVGRVTGDLYAPPDQRFRRGELVEVYVWDASVSLLEGPVAATVGRFRPRLAPGVWLIDGVQAGARLFDGMAEMGAYAGLIPELVSIYPSFERLTAGAYFGMDIEAAPGVVLLPRARAGVISTPDFARQRAELEVLTELFWANVVTVGATVRAGMLGQRDPLPSLDAVRFDAQLTAVENLRLWTNYRYTAGVVVDFDARVTGPLGATPLGAAHQGNLQVSYALWPSLAVGGLAGAGYDVDTDLARGWIGPELLLPTAFGDVGGLDFGFLEELGGNAGRSAWVGARLNLPSVRVTTRGSYFETTAIGDPFREAGLMVIADAPLLPWLSLRGRGYLQQALGHVGGLPRETPTLVMLDAALLGAWP